MSDFMPKKDSGMTIRQYLNNIKSCNTIVEIILSRKYL